MEENNRVVDIIESSCIIDGDKVKCTPLDTSIDEFYVDYDHPCSMLMNGFTKNVLNTIENTMLDDFKKHIDELDTYELLLPDIISKHIKMI